MSELSGKSAKEFAASVLPLYCGPHIKLRITSSENEYTVSRSLLCSESSYFSTIFDENCLGDHRQTVTLERREGVVSVQSLEALIQWLYLRVVKFDIQDPGDQIDAAIELVRFADLYKVVGLETLMAEYIKNIIILNPHPKTGPLWRHADTNTYCLASRHIASAFLLPSQHPVRGALAAASVEGFLRDPNHKFVQETQTYPSFGADVLKEVGTALDGLKSASNVAFKDPISGCMVEIKSTPII